MYAKYIKKEYPDLNGTGHTQAYYKMLTTPMGYEDFVELKMDSQGYVPRLSASN